MTKSLTGLLKSLCAMLAAALMFVSGPAMAIDRCATDSGPCLALCGEPDCDLPADDGNGDTKSCAHCAFGHFGTGLSAPADAAEHALDPSSVGYSAVLAAWFAATPRDGPDHPPKA